MAKKKKEKQMTIKLRAYEHTPLGRLIEYLHNHYPDSESVVVETLMSRFMPFILDSEDSGECGLARQYISKCESYARASREHLGWKLPVTQTQVVTSEVQNEEEEKAAVEDKQEGKDKKMFALSDQLGL